jgi:hypothetical protein
MAAAETSIALAGGSELPRETAALELNGQDLRTIPQSIALCRATVRAIRRNIAFAACYNIVGISLAAAGLLHPVVAALIMLVSSLTVTWRVLRDTSDAALMRSVAQSAAKPRNAEPFRWSLPRLERLVFAIALALQGPVIAWLGGFTGSTAAGFIALFLAAGLITMLWSRDRLWSPAARMTMAMFSVGGFAMLIGWWADAGFGAVVRDGEDGFLVPIRSGQALADRIQQLLDDRPLRDRFGSAARRRAREFTWARYGERLLSALGVG